MSTRLKTSTGHFYAHRLAEEQESLADYILKTIEGRNIPIPGKKIFTIRDGTCYYLNFGYVQGHRKFDSYTRLAGETESEAVERLGRGVVVLNSGIVKMAVPITSIDQIFVQ